jgi:hypothetical protein
MARNQKLTAVIKGRTITAVEPHAGGTTVRFEDGSVMTVKTGDQPPSGASPATGKVRAVRQQGTRLSIDLEAGRVLELTTAEPTSTVMLRDASGRLEYAD